MNKIIPSIRLLEVVQVTDFFFQIQISLRVLMHAFCSTQSLKTVGLRVITLHSLSITQRLYALALFKVVA